MKESRGITPLRTILQNCLNHIENLETNRSISDNYDKEFQDLKQFSETLKAQKEYSCTEGEKEVNRKKNRYKDILPFNVSRVILSEYAGIPGSDYINANFIKGASGSPAYIASQGPLPNTVNDFWRMVVECEVQVIVMACNAQESGKHKCENYWVEKEGEEKRFGMVQICLVKASTVCPDFLVRTMRLKYTNDKDITEERTVCQFHYSAWPDHGVPPLVRPLLDMVRLVRDTQASETLPVLVHCSAGCGRTGTICAIDFVWGLLRAGKLTEEFSLFNLVKDMRKQRVAMVQTKEQYILVHQAVRELFKEQLRVIESHPYENIDFNGVPLIKDFEEPFYDTICPIQKDEICDEKQDKSEMNEKGEDVEGRINKMDAAPPLPRKKRPNVLFSKQEKEAENLTEKNRSSFAEKERDRTDASLSSLLGKPRIVKLRALFEKSPATKERAGLKDRGSQTVSRSHSLGAIRKPLTTEVFEPQGEKSKPSNAPSPPTSDFTKLKNSKSFSKSVPLIKRSKSLKSFSQPANLCISTTSNANDYKTVKSYHPRLYEAERPMANENERTFRKFTTTCDIVEVSGLAKECSKRRRSLESLMGDGPPSITWPTVVMSVEKSSSNNHKGRERGLEWSPKLSTGTVPGSLTADMLKHQLQRLSLETEKKMNSFVSGIGVRERRNSFRQAVNKSDIRSVFRDRESHGFPTKKLLANESAPTHRNGSHSKNMKNANEISPMVDQPDGVVYLEREAPHDVKLSVAKSKSIFDVKKYKLQEKPSVSGEAQAPVPVKRIITRHPQQNSLAPNHIILEPRTSKGIMAPKNSKSEEPDRTGESKNLFLKKLNSEIYERERDGESNEPRSRSNFDESDKTTRFVSGSGLVRSDSKKTIFRTNAIKPAGSFCSSSDNFDEMDSSRSAEGSNTEKKFQSSAWQNSKSNPSHQTYVNVSKPLKPFECYKCYTNSSPIHPTSYGKAVHSHKSIPYQNSAGESSNNLRRDEAPHKEPFFLGSHKKNVCSVVPPKSNSGHDSEASFSSYRKNHTSNSDMPVYVTVGSEFEINDKNLPLPPKMTTAGKISKNYDSIPWSHPVASRSSGEMSSSEHSSDSSRLLPQYEAENLGKTEVKVIKITEQAKGMNKSRLSDSSEVTASKQKRPEELKQNSSVDFCNYGVFGTSKPKQNASKYSKDDFLLEEPTAPPRVKRHASVTVPRNTLNGSDHAAPWVTAEKKFGNSRSASLQAENAWNGSIGVDLDAVAASMQQDKSLTTLKDWSAKNPLNSSTNSTVKKKQHYL